MAYEVSDKIKKAYKAHEKKREIAKKISSGKELRKHAEKAHAEGKTNLDYHQGRSLMRHVNKPN